MKIYTSYFAINATHPQAKSISRWTPKWFKGPSIPLLAPCAEILEAYKSTGDKEHLYEAYLERLNEIGIERVRNVLRDGDILLCYEKSDDFCHRHVLAWFLTQHGVEVEELRTRKE